MTGPARPDTLCPEGSNADPRRIVVVGPCASGKSTLVAALRTLGYDARVSGQEHSEIARLWMRQEPDVLIALKVDVVTVSQRRGWDWPAWLHEIQMRRLSHAIAAADLLIDTSRTDADEMVNLAVVFLRRTRPARCPPNRAGRVPPRAE